MSSSSIPNTCSPKLTAMTPISSQIPDDIVSLIRNMSDSNLTDADLEKILPDFHVRVAVVDEGKGIPVSPDTQEKAQAWIRQQLGFQQRASEAWALLQREQPLTKDAIAKGGELPAWFGSAWTAGIMFDWAVNLHIAVADAEQYISEQGLNLQKS